MLSMSTSVRGKRQCGTSLTITSCLAMALRAMAPNWLKPPSKTAGELDYDCNDYILKPRVKITNNINEKKYILFKRERGAPRGLASLFVPWLLAAFFGQPTPITTHLPIVQVMPYWWMHCVWHGFAKKIVRTDLPWWGSCAIVRATAACFVVVGQMCLLYNTPSQPCETFPQ